MRHNSVTYIVGFATAICVVCSLLVSASATFLKERQLTNARLDKQKKVLAVSGLVDSGLKLAAADVDRLFKDHITSRIVHLETGEDAADSEVDPATYDQQKALKDPALSREVDRNLALVRKVPTYGLVYEVRDEAKTLTRLVLPVEGKGLWSTLYGFLALDVDTTTIRGLTFYKHGETPGLGGEVDNPSWIAKWPDRKAFDENWVPQIQVIKGAAGPAVDDPYRVDGLSGATLTCNGVTFLLQFWLGPDGFGPFLEDFRGGGGSA
jgi:Na+-transporting NADH:ubiquinone oxidoreductase subunit C